ncbi:MAG: hypothetical protein Q9168_001421 [Polycauliona sp. 1 TL-2023]
MAVSTPLAQASHGDDAGQFALVKPLQDEPAWPIIICPEEIVLEFFKKAWSRPEAARRADGTFSKAYGRSQHLLPILYLGNLRMRWAKRIQLGPLDPQAATTALDTNLDTTLAYAYTEYLEQYGRNDIHYWSSRLLAKRLAEDEHANTDEGELVQLQAAQTTAKIPESNSLHKPHRGDSSDEEILNSGIPQSKKVKLEGMDSRFVSPTPSHTLHRSNAGSPNSGGCPEVAAAAGGIKVEAEDVNNGKIQIYVDNPYVIYRVKASNLDKASPLLASYCQGGKGNCYIWSPSLSAISAEDFRPVAEFVDSGEYHPYIIDAGTERAHLNGISNVQDKKTEVLKCGVVYTLARQFNLPKLQTLVISKLRTLKPYPAEELITMTKLAFGSGLGEGDRLDKLLVTYIADHYFDISAEATGLFNKLLKDNLDLKSQVFATMAGSTRMESTVKGKEPKIEAVTRMGGGIEEDERTNEKNSPQPNSGHSLGLVADEINEDGIRIYDDEET